MRRMVEVRRSAWVEITTTPSSMVKLTRLNSSGLACSSTYCKAFSAGTLSSWSVMAVSCSTPAPSRTFHLGTMFTPVVLRK